MATKKDSAVKWLKTALEMEERGNNFYLEAAGKCRNDAAKEIFDMLGKDEIVHMKRIKGIYESLNAGKGWSKSWEAKKFEHGDLKKVFAKLAKKHDKDIRADASDMDALGVGVDLEHGSIKFYKERLGKAGDPLEKKFLERMVSEEQSHLEALLDMKDFLTDPAAWHLKKERHMPV